MPQDSYKRGNRSEQQTGKWKEKPKYKNYF